MLKIKVIPGTEEIAAALKDNQGYCICMPSKNVDTKCPCRSFREAQVEGECHCGRQEKIKVDE